MQPEGMYIIMFNNANTFVTLNPPCRRLYIDLVVECCENNTVCKRTTRETRE
jgi:hypothetical protein